jgi:hypothetical protein
MYGEIPDTPTRFETEDVDKTLSGLKSRVKDLSELIELQITSSYNIIHSLITFITRKCHRFRTLKFVVAIFTVELT